MNTITETTSAPVLEGIIPPVVTPLLKHDTLDQEALAKVLERLIQAGVHGIFVLGTSGETFSLSNQLRESMIEASASIIAGRVPLFVGITESVLAHSLDLSKVSAKHGATAVVAAPPYYLPPSQAELEHYMDLLLAKVELPCMLYNIPQLTKTPFSQGLLDTLFQRPEVIGIKDSSGDMSYFLQTLQLTQERPHLSTFMGPEMLLIDAVLNGASGGVLGGANLFPKFYVEVWKAARARDFEALKPMRATIQSIHQLYQIGQYHSCIIKALKASLAELNLIRNLPEEPFEPFAEKETQEIQHILSQLRQDPLLTADLNL